MEKFFNTAGPCMPAKHYTISTASDFERIDRLIANEHYFILHAPRQTGKTTLMLELMKTLNKNGKYIALYVNIEAAQPFRNDIVSINNLIISEFESSAMTYLDAALRPSKSCFEIRSMQRGISEFLSCWCMELPKPLVVLMDEVDSLIGDGLLSVLRQLRAGYTKRPKAFPHALCLCGLRDIRDYRIYSDGSQSYIIGGSAFNIKEKSIRLADFTREQVGELFAQHTHCTQQLFSDSAIQKIFDLTQGQPWLVNALGRELCFDEYAISSDQTILVTDVDKAVEILIQRCDVHLDQLMDKLTEPRVARIIESLLLGEENTSYVEEDQRTSLNEDQQYLIDLGLVRIGEHGLEIANPIYREIVPRALTMSRQNMLGQNPQWYIKTNGLLDIEKVLNAYIQFYKEHSELITQRKTYTEAAHHLLFMAWLQRIVNGGGTITREYAAGLGRLDLCITFAGEKFAFELKLSGKTALSRGKKQLANYLAKLDLPSGWLIIFSRADVVDMNKVGQREHFEEGDKRIDVIWL